MINKRTFLGKLSFPNYPRQIELSKAQRPKYWEWNGTTIKSGSKKLLQKYINQDYRQDIINNNGNILPQWLKKDYNIIGFKKDKIYTVFDKETEEWYINTLVKGKVLNENTRFYLVNELNDVKIISNPTQAGKPKLHIISGQDFHVGLNPHIRTKVVDCLHNFYNERFKETSLYKDYNKLREILSMSYPLQIEMEIKDTVKSMFDNTKKGNGKHWDVGNRALPYMKTFLDFLDKGSQDFASFIEDDDRLHISSGNNSYFTPIENYEDRELVFYFYTDNREIFKKYLNNDNSN